MRKVKKKNTGKYVGLVFAFLTIVSGFIALYFINDKEQNDEQNKEIYERIKDEAKETPTDPSINEDFTIDWEVFKDTDVVAWIKFGDYIDYPVVHREDNSYYLKHTYDGQYNSGGSIFMDMYNHEDFTDYNTILYGHNMHSLTMFGIFKKYLNKEVEMPREFFIYLPDGTKHTYKVFSINQVNSGGLAYQIGFDSLDEFEEYQKTMEEGSAFDTGGVADKNKKIVTLSTCAVIGSHQGKRVVILGQEKSIKQIQEPASWYKKEKVEE